MGEGCVCGGDCDSVGLARVTFRLSRYELDTTTLAPADLIDRDDNCRVSCVAPPFREFRDVDDPSCEERTTKNRDDVSTHSTLTHWQSRAHCCAGCTIRQRSSCYIQHA